MFVDTVYESINGHSKIFELDDGLFTTVDNLKIQFTYNLKRLTDDDIFFIHALSDIYDIVIKNNEKVLSYKNKNHLQLIMNLQ